MNRPNSSLTFPSLIRLPSMVLFLLIAVILAGCSNPKIIVHQLDEREANEIIVFLARRGITAEKVKAESSGAGGGGGLLWNIQVDASDAIEAQALLNANGLPRRAGQSLLGIFQEGGLVPSEMQEKVRFQEGKAEQLASTIRKFDGIIDADVQLSFPEEDIFNPEASALKEVKASVYVKHQGVMDDPNALLETKIKRLVAGAIDGLEFKNVTIISERARFLGDTSLLGGKSKDEKDFVSIWSVVVASDSVGRFRSIFFSFTVILVLCLVTALWILWKFIPLLSFLGFGELFSFSPISISRLREDLGGGASEALASDEEEEEDEEDEDEEDEEEEED